jgi:nucleoside phosphorylase
MGPLPAQHATFALLSFAEVRLIAIVGVAGSLSHDVSLGDVVIAESINEYQANSKAVPDGESYEIHYSGRQWALPWAIREAVSNFRFAANTRHEKWLIESDQAYADCFNSDDRVQRRRPKYHVGRVASGNVVSAASAFVEELKEIDRKFAAIEMEAAGVAAAAAARIHPVPWLVLRGVSDQSDESKTRTDLAPSGSWRRYAVRNAATLLRGLLDWDDFCIAAGIKVSSAESSGSPPFSDLLNSLRDETGARWLVGIAVGVLTHVPVDSDPGGIADIGTRRAHDPELDTWLREVEVAFHELSATGAVDRVSDRIRALIRAFRRAHPSAAIANQLNDFDEVAQRALDPAADDPSGYLLVEADRLEEDAGRGAAMELLWPFASRVQVRARIVSLLAADRNWGEIDQMLASVPAMDLDRSECENLIEARVKLGHDASELLTYHSNRYDDAAARIFRRHCAL